MENQVPLKRYLSLHFGAVAILPVVIIAGLVCLFMMPAIQHRTEIQHQTLARAIADNVSTHLACGERQLIALSGYFQHKQFQTDTEVVRLLDAHCGNGEFFEALFIVDNANATVQAVGLPKSRRSIRADFVGLDLSGQRFIDAMQKGSRVVWSENFLSTISKRVAVALMVPLEGGSFIIGEITLDKLSSYIRHPEVESELLTLMVDGRGVIVADSRNRHMGEVLQLAYSDADGSAGHGTAAVAAKAFEWNGEEMLGTLVAMDAAGWKILVAQPRQKAFEPLRNTLGLIGLGLAVALVLMLTVSWILSGRFAGLVGSYTEKAESIADGQYALKWPVGKTKEFTRLGQSFGRMVEKISQREKALHLTQFIFDDAPIGIWRIGRGGEILDVNEAGCNSLGYSREELLSMNVFDFDLDFDAAAWVDNMATLESVGTRNIESRHQRKNGEIFPIQVIQNLMRFEGEVFHVAFVQDITERKRIEQSLRESEARFRALHNASFGGITIHDKGLILECNQGLSDITGYSFDELIGMDGLLLIAEQSRSVVMDKIVSGYEKPYEAIGLRKNGDEFPIQLEARNIPYKGKKVQSVEFRDITEQKKSEQEKEELQGQLVQAQKIESIGRLAGGVAHDLNNLLSPILGYSEMLLEDANLNDAHQAKLKSIHKAGQGARNLVGQLLAFSRKQTLDFRLVDLDSILSGFEALIRRTIREDIHINIISSSEKKTTMADKGNLEQIIMNLSVNAADAMPDGGELTIETGIAQLDKAYASKHPDVVPGPHVFMSFIDTGHGMDSEMCRKIFEPFYSTKGNQGTGLGLATVYGIVKQHKGNIWVYSEVDKGSVFKIYLPHFQGDKIDLVEKKEADVDLKGTETILLAEDNDDVRTLASEILTHNGYTVFSAENGNDALELWASCGESIELLVTDVVMPEMNGKELFSTLSSLDEHMKVLYMSGYPDNTIAHHGVLDDNIQYIQKPFNTDDFLLKVRQVLDKKI